MVFLIIMGVCGCGKTTIGKMCAKELNIPFNDADDFHTQANKRKMNQGIPLTDEDRFPWLLAIHQHMKNSINSGQQGVVACSSLKKKYRNTLLTGCENGGEMNRSIENDVLFIYLKGTASVIKKRLLQRTNHFMPASLLDSQLAILEEPDQNENHINVDIDSDTSDIVKNVLYQIIQF